MTIKKDEAIQGILDDFEKLANTVLEQLDYMEHFITSGELSVSDEVLSFLAKNEELIDKMEVKLSDKIVVITSYSIHYTKLYDENDERRIFAVFHNCFHNISF